MLKKCYLSSVVLGVDSTLLFRLGVIKSTETYVKRIRTSVPLGKRGFNVPTQTTHVENVSREELQVSVSHR